MRGHRVLGIAVASGRVGYVFLLGSKLYAWGLSRKAAEGPEEAERMVSLWIARMHPDIVVVEKIPDRCRKGEKSKAIIQAITELVANAPLYDISVARRRTFRNKYAAAAALVERFPDLRSRLPAKRKVWDTEPRNTTIFEALTLALVVIDGASEEGPHMDGRGGEQ